MSKNYENNNNSEELDEEIELTPTQKKLERSAWYGVLCCCCFFDLFFDYHIRGTKNSGEWVVNGNYT